MQKSHCRQGRLARTHTQHQQQSQRVSHYSPTRLSPRTSYPHPNPTRVPRTHAARRLQIGQLPALAVLNIADNAIEALPGELSDLKEKKIRELKLLPNPIADKKVRGAEHGHGGHV